MAMKGKLRQYYRSRSGRTLMLVFVGLSLIGAAYGFKTSYVPGPVSAAQPRGESLNGYDSHASFEKECKHCHAPVRCLSANLCQDCHMEVARERAESSGLHGLLPGTNKCQNCHKEHQGRDAVMSAIPLANVDHERLTGFSLVRHEVDHEGNPLECTGCHRDGRFSSGPVDCKDCHRSDNPDYIDGHAQLYGDDCVVCHDGQDRMMEWDHASVFVLEGAHENAQCEDCHIEQTFTGMSSDCIVCHPDPEVHAGQFGLDCARCHGVAAWIPAQLTQHTFHLDHGGEGQVECEVCHVDTYVVYTCYGCHDHEPIEMRKVHAQEHIATFEACDECHPTGQQGEAVQDGDGVDREGGG